MWRGGNKKGERLKSEEGKIKEGKVTPGGSEVYTGSKWGKYLRAPQIFFKILEKGKGKLVPLKEIAEVRRGFTTGANEFFYLTEEEIKRKGIEKEFWMHKDEEGNWIPNYVIKSPRECKSIVVKPEDLKYRVLMIHKDKKDLKGTKVLRYINEGERKGFHKRPTCASRGRWYDLGKRKPAPININYLINDVARAFIGDYWASDDFQEIHTEENIAPFLNGSLFWFLQNLEGRTSFGGGLLKIQTYEFQNIFVCLDVKYDSKINNAFMQLVSRPVDSIFTELSASTSEEVTLDKIKPDRRELDKIIMGEILGLSEEEQLEVYRAVVDLVKSRLERAKSLKKRKKTKEGVDIDLLVKTVKEKIGENTLGKFYKERILSRKNLTSRRLPKAGGKTKIEAGLFGWRLYSGRAHIDCSSELEARYLKIWADIGLARVKMPKDLKYLKNIISNLEKLHKENNKVIESYLESIIDVKTQAKIRDLIWQEIMD